MNIEEAFLQSSIKKFETQKSLGDKTFVQLDKNNLLFKPSNAIKKLPALPRKGAGVVNSPPSEPAHLEMPGKSPPEISLKEEGAPVSSNGTGAFLNET